MIQNYSRGQKSSLDENLFLPAMPLKHILACTITAYNYFSYLNLYHYFRINNTTNLIEFFTLFVPRIAVQARRIRRLLLLLLLVSRESNFHYYS